MTTAATIYHVEKEMLSLASKVYILATGLQNAAPPGTTGKSIQYLIEVAAMLEKERQNISALLPDGGAAQLRQSNRREF